jgi:LmbE family N-acetylglucosaminyl deacetylase
MTIRRLALLLVLLAAPRLSLAQGRGAAAFGDAVLGLGTTARVLVIGAHPDDEDTNLITWLTRGQHVETAYLSLTRGDGGQNLIGDELGPALGVIRTEELLAARRLDGGHQYFTRAYDFGFSKTAEETFRHWPRDSILKDVVTVVRAFRPHVIVAMFSGTPRDGHGHHQVSGILAREAFDAAADTIRFPRAATSGLGAWTPAKFYRGAYTIDRDKASLVFNVGAYDPLLGRSYAELAAESRSQHLSQGFGIVQAKGARLDYLKLEASHVPANMDGRETSMFAGIDTSWGRFRGAASASVTALIDSLVDARREARARLDLIAPTPMVAPLARVLRLAMAARARIGCPDLPVPRCDGGVGGPGDLAVSLETTIERAKAALIDAAGIGVEAFAEREQVAIGDSVKVAIAVYNQGTQPSVQWEGTEVAMGAGNWPRGFTDAVQHAAPREIRPDSAARDTLWLHADSVPTQPWWLRLPLAGDVFQLPTVRVAGYDVVPQLVLGDDRVHGSAAHVQLSVAGATFAATVAPIVYRYANPARGEQRRPVATVPAISVVLDGDVAYARAGTPIDRAVRVHLRSGATRAREATVSLRLPRGLTAEPRTQRTTLPAFGNGEVTFRVRGTVSAGRERWLAVATSAGESYASGYVPIEYEHIEPRRLYRVAELAVEGVDVQIPASLRVGYIRGVSDNVEPMLEQLGIPVTVIDPATLSQRDLSRFTTIVVGPRAFGANEALMANNDRLLAFARNGGTLVEQYGQYEMTRPGVLPYPITLARPADRVTEEDAAVRILDPASPLLNVPNRIRPGDFADWVQERSSYMPHTWAPEYRTLLSMNDAGEPPKNSGILVAPVGKGTFVYATLAFFRQLPAGNPGAARLFVNLMAAGGRVVP